MEKVKNIEWKILNVYKKRFSSEELFFHLIERIKLHIYKLTNLKKDKEKQNVLLREVADLYLLARILLYTEKVSKEIIEKSSEYYYNKIKKLF